MADLFSMDDSSMGFLDKKAKASDGIYRPSLNLALDKKKGYRAVLRFLPNWIKDEEGNISTGLNAIEKIQHYVKLPNYPDLNGYYDSMRNFEGEQCELSTTYWQLAKSKSAVDNENAKLIGQSKKYYSYVQIVEDDNQPDLVGKVMIFSYGPKIKDKIAQEWSGEITGSKCNVFDLANGKDFVLLIKDGGQFPNYDSSTFRPETSVIKIGGKELPTTVNEDGKKIIPSKFKDGIISYVFKRDKELAAFAPKRWTDEERVRVSKIVSILTNNPIVGANQSINTVANDDFFSATTQTNSAPKLASYGKSETVSTEDTDDALDFFNDIM